MARQTPEQRAMAESAAAELGIDIPDPTPRTTSGADTTATETPTTSPFLNTMQSKLLEQSNLVSSLDTQVEDSFARAREGIQAGVEAGTQRIESQFDRAIQETRRGGQDLLTSQVEGRRGFATNRVAMLKLSEDIDREVKDLAQRREELILQGQSQAAGQLADLEVQQLKFKADAQQKYFNNLLGVANFSLSAQSQAEQIRQFEVTNERQEREFNVNTFMQSLDLPLPTPEELADMSDAELQDNFLAYGLAEGAGIPADSVRAVLEATAEAQHSDDAYNELQMQLVKSEIANNYSLIAERGKETDDGNPAPSEGFFNYDIEVEARADAGTYQELIQAGEFTTEQAYAVMRSKYSNNEVTDDALMKLLGADAVLPSDLTGPLPGESFQDFYALSGDFAQFNTKATTPGFRFLQPDNTEQGTGQQESPLSFEINP